MKKNGIKSSKSASGAIDYQALINAYKVISEYRKADPESIDDGLKNRFESWRAEKSHSREKQIAEMVVLDEMLYSFCFGEEINRKMGFEVIPPDRHL